MAIVNDYITGSITLTSGSASFTSSGAALQSANVRAGDETLLPAKGMVLVIASITGENAGTLVATCPAGAAGASQPMRIRFQPDGSRYTAAARALVELLADGKLSSLAGQTGAADKLPYLTGATTFGLTGLSAFARTLLDDANAPALWATLGATAPADVAFRRGNILASVAQSGGVPTGGLIEAATNANGDYMRFADGTQICVVSPAINFTAVADVSVTLPAAFAGSRTRAASLTCSKISGSNSVNVNAMKSVNGLMASPGTTIVSLSVTDTTYNATIPAGSVRIVLTGGWY
jgi:hypothetical protein